MESGKTEERETKRNSKKKMDEIEHLRTKEKQKLQTAAKHPCQYSSILQTILPVAFIV